MVKSPKENDTIGAIATPPGQGAIGIIRLSGPNSLQILEKVWEGRVSPSQFQPRHLYIGHIQALKTKDKIDQVIVFIMKSPHSYTGEDVVEIQGHGGSRLLETILKNLMEAGARHAEPGEFTKRAFLNGRMDLAQAEAVADLIQASSNEAATLATKQLAGRLSEYVGQLRNNLKVMRAQMEAMIDFPEDGDIQELRIGYHGEIKDRVSLLLRQIEHLLKTYAEGRAFREGICVAIVGKPNVGKSSLFNALLQEDRAIVHPTPGTTRDLIEEVLEVQGLSIRFIDTAGIRDGQETVESEGIYRTQKRLRQADLVLVVIDSSRPLDSQDQLVFESVQGQKCLSLYNKIDLPPALSKEKLEKTMGSMIQISAKEGTGIDLLKKTIFKTFVSADSPSSRSEVILTNLRHRNALQKGTQALQRVLEGCEEKRSLELLVADLSQTMDALGEVTGEVTNDEILGEIFSKFCIGK